MPHRSASEDRGGDHCAPSHINVGRFGTLPCPHRRRVCLSLVSRMPHRSAAGGPRQRPLCAVAHKRRLLRNSARPAPASYLHVARFCACPTGLLREDGDGGLCVTARTSDQNDEEETRHVAEGFRWWIAALEFDADGLMLGLSVGYPQGRWLFVVAEVGSFSTASVQREASRRLGC